MYIKIKNVEKTEKVGRCATNVSRCIKPGDRCVVKIIAVWGGQVRAERETLHAVSGKLKTGIDK